MKMRSLHVSKNLSAYCHGELPDEESRAVAEHLIGCQSCRQEFEEIKFGVKLAEQLPLASAPASLWSEIEAALERAPQSGSERPKSTRLFPFIGWKPLATACALLLLMLAVGMIWYYNTRQQPGAVPQVVEGGTPQTHEQPVVPENNSTTAPDAVASGDNQQPNNRDTTDENVKNKPATRASNVSPAWEVARVAGAPKVGATHLVGSGRLAVGEWLETDHSSRAKINVADIGQVDIGPNSRVRLVGTSPTEHRLALTRGRLHAMINAPPRLFFVDTPSAVAVDLGCAYTLEVDDKGRSVLHVTAGWVALERGGREAIVPAGAVCETQPGVGPGTPYFDDASPKFREALSKFDFQNGGGRALSVVLSEARELDTLTLWHLLTRVRGAERERVYDRLASLITPPAGVTKAGVMKLNKRMLDLWKQELEWAWFE